MAGTAVTPAPAGVVFGGGGTPNNGINPSLVNSQRISAVIDRLSFHVTNHLTDGGVLLSHCLSLARGIDYGIANHDIPNRAQELPSLLKQVCQLKGDTNLLAAIMVLMISVKNACQSGWFSDRDSEELRNLVKGIANNFGSLSQFTADPEPPSVISIIMSRFYPRMKMGRIFAFLEVKPGFDAYMSDFQISKNIKYSPGDRIRLIIVQTDSIETSSCLISPAKVNFLLNGKGVEKRTSLFVDTGPQIPTAVTNLLKYGSNLLQAVGEFDGNYIIAVAIMSEMPNPDSNALQDYQQHTPATVNSDSEVIEGASRVSLICPISFTRIKTPVKGHSCKHIQCFDFDNYVDINSRRPSWRCPNCNQHVCFTDIRIDQKMVKILKEVEPNISNIVVSSDGSWNAAMDTDDAIPKPVDETSDTGQHEPPQDVDLLDLTLTDDLMDDVIICETEDTKLAQNAGQHQNMPVNQSSSHGYDDFWSRIYLSTIGQGMSNSLSNEQRAGVSTLPPILLNSNTTNGGFESFLVNGLNTSVPQGETSLPNTLQMPQQHQFGNPNITPEYGRFPSLPRNVTRTPIAIQALPAQPSPSVQQRSRGVNSFTQNGLSAASQQMSSSTLPQYPGVQLNHPFGPFPFFLPPQQQQQNIALQASNQAPSRPTSNVRMAWQMSQSQGPIQSSMQQIQTPVDVRPQAHVGVPHSPTNTTAQQMASTNRPSPAYSMIQRSNVRVAASQPVMRTDDPTQPNWRPAGRMRGALSGQAYLDAWNQYIITPNQQAQAIRPNYPSVGSVNMSGGSDILPN